MKYISTILLFFIFFRVNSQTPSEKYLSPIHLANTQMIKYKGSTATCYLVVDSAEGYLITVLHLFSKKIVRKSGKPSSVTFSQYDSLLCKSGDTLSLDVFGGKKWQSLKGKIFFFDKPNEHIDLCVIKIAVRPTISSLYLIDGSAFLGQQCFFVGYPLGLKSPTDSNMDFDIPVVKNSIFSGSFVDPNTKENMVLLDGNNTYGLSGAPIFTFNQTAKAWRLMGMVTSYYKQTDHVFNSRTGTTEEKEENSGIVCGVGAIQILELIGKARHSRLDP